MIKHYKKINRKFYNDYLPFLFYRFQRIFLASFISKGKKLWSYNFLLNIKYELKLKEKMESHIIFIFSLLNISPNIILSYLKIGGQKQGVPLAISWRKKITYALKWIKSSLIEKYKKIKIKNLIEELILSIYNKGIIVKKKKKTYLEGFSNRFLLKKFKYKYKN